MPFALIGFTLGMTQPGNQFDILLLAKVILCMVFARTAAMAFNRYADRFVDEKNMRTNGREIPSGKVSAHSALLLVFISSGLFILTAYWINKLCLFLSPLALAVVLGYSYTKRFTWLCHLILGIGLSLAPIGAYLAVTGTFHLVPLCFSFAVIFWVSGFDIIYALQDEEFDRISKLHSMPAAFGKKKALTISKLLHVISISSLVLAGLLLPFHWIFWLGLTTFAFMLIYQHSLVKQDDLSRINIAFFTMNGVASLLFAFFSIVDLSVYY